MRVEGKEIAVAVFVDVIGEVTGAAEVLENEFVVGEVGIVPFQFFVFSFHK